ncbi:MAG: MFS transporter [Thermoproteota archaeon]
MNEFRKNVIGAAMAHASNHVFQLTLPAILPLVMAEFNLSHYSAGLLLSSFSFPYAFLQPSFGWASDKFGRKKLIVIGLLASSFAMLLTGLSKDPLHIFAFQFVAGASSAAYHPAGIPLISESSEEKRRGGALGVHQMAGAVGSFLPPIIASVVAGDLGWRGVSIFASSAGFCVTGLSSLILVERGSNGGEFPRAAFLEVLKRKPILFFLGASLVALTAYRGVTAFASAYVVEAKGASVEEASIYYAILQISGMLGGPVGGLASDKFGRRNALMAFVTLESVPMFFLPHAGKTALAADFAIVGFSSFAVLAVQDAYLSDLAPKEVLGSSYGLLLASSFIPAAAVPPAMGAMIDRAGYENSFVAAAMLTLVGVPLFFLVQKSKG